jgi:hypothetical protein
VTRPRRPRPLAAPAPVGADDLDLETPARLAARGYWAPVPPAPTLDAYLRDHPRVGNAPLFPGRTDPAQALKKADAEYLLTHAETAAKLPKRERGVFHPYHRLWA